VKMPMDSVTEENVEKIMSQLEGYKADMGRLENTTREMMWLEDLEKLDKELI